MRIFKNYHIYYLLLSCHCIYHVWTQGSNFEVAQSINKFALRILSETTNQAGDDLNLALSPYTIWSLLAVLSEGARGSTRTELEKALSLPGNSAKTLRTSYRNHRTALLSNDEAVQVDLSNAIFTPQKFALERIFETNVRDYYFTDVIPAINYENIMESIRQVNSYVSNATNNRINNFANRMDLENARLFLVSTLFFKGQWQKPFNKTIPSKFYDELDNIRGDVNMMYLRASFPYTNVTDIKSHALEIPYGESKKYSMIIILPFKKEKLSSALTKLQKSGFSTVLKALEHAAVEYEGDDVHIYLPRFTINSDLNLNNVLRQLNIRSIFEPDKVDLRGIINEYLYVTRVIQQAQIQVNEEGTVASSASGAGLGYRTLTPKFNANRDFAYFIVEKQTRTIIFTGKVTNPNTLN